jgi:hypothetical protein
VYVGSGTEINRKSPLENLYTEDSMIMLFMRLFYDESKVSRKSKDEKKKKQSILNTPTPLTVQQFQLVIE